MKTKTYIFLIVTGIILFQGFEGFTYAATSEEIRWYLEQNPGILNDPNAMLAAMNKYGVTANDLSAATGLTPVQISTATTSAGISNQEVVAAGQPKNADGSVNWGAVVANNVAAQSTPEGTVGTLTPSQISQLYSINPTKANQIFQQAGLNVPQSVLQQAQSGGNTYWLSRWLAEQKPAAYTNASSGISEMAKSYYNANKDGGKITQPAQPINPAAQTNNKSSESIPVFSGINANPYQQYIPLIIQQKINTWISSRVLAKKDSMSTDKYNNFIEIIIGKLNSAKATTSNKSKLTVINYITYELQLIQYQSIDNSFLDEMVQ